MAAILSLLSMPLRRVHDQRPPGDDTQVAENAPVRSSASEQDAADWSAGQREGMFVPGVDSLPLADGWSRDAAAARSRVAKPSAPAAAQRPATGSDGPSVASRIRPRPQRPAKARFWPPRAERTACPRWS